MASFVGLKIQGIRSIGDNPHSINFLTPLTIIQGPNGTGKTTIIEALNYVTTGALPSGKMQTFIHNNEIANRQRVDALVQLVFTDIRGNKCTATKRMNASSTRGGKLTTKSDEFTLKIVDKFGNPKIISSKVADFNKEMITLLGVPKAVLEHVLFCHQEESNWPLSEPKELKLRFDAIFEVTKFVKALDNVKKNVKELKMQIQLVDKELPHLENNLRARADLILNCDQSRASLKQMGTTIDKLREEKKMLEGELVQVRTLVAKAQNANHEFEVLQGTINAHMHHIEGLANVDEFYAGSPEELELEISMLKQSAGIQEAENQHLTIAQEITSIRAQIEECKQAEQAFRDQQMKFDSRQMMMRNREQEYVNLLRQYSEKYEIPLSQNFVEQMQEKMDKIEAETSGFVQTEKKRAEELTERIEELRQKFAEHRNNDRTKRQEFFKLSQAITKAENEFRGAETASDAVGKLSAEIAKWEVQLRSMGDFKLLDAIWDSLQELQTQLNALRMDMLQLDGESFKQQSTAVLERANESLDKTLEHIGTLKQRVKITNQMADFKDRKAVASEKAIQLETFKQHLEEKKERLTEVETLLKSSAQALPVVEKELRELEAEKRAILEGIIKRERESAMDADSIDYAVTKINEIKTADARDKQANSSVENFREKMEEQRAEIQRLAEHQRLLESRLAGVEQKKHQLRLLEGQLKRMHIQKEVDQLQRKLEEAKENAQVDGVQNLAELKKKEHRLNQKTVEVNNQIYQKTGEQVQLRKKIEDLKKQLADPRYEGAKKDYLDKLVDRQIISATIDDLDNYYKVVDNAIIKFHQRKMEQINSILSELWSRVYQGNDIETIKIKSQPVSGAEKKKSYDYSVVMTVDQKDIDMRDRCSAGQKVLASILIRIALADVFAGNCRILALDEPTTNLDQDKVENIGSMLKSLIEVANPSAGSAIGARELSELDEDDFNSTVGDDGETRAQNDEPTTSEQQKGGGRLRSLQLIVITHDHRLVEHLYLACRPEYIYGLSKDENGVSRIIQHNQMGQTADLSMAT